MIKQHDISVLYMKNRFYIFSLSKTSLWIIFILEFLYRESVIRISKWKSFKLLLFDSL